MQPQLELATALFSCCIQILLDNSSATVFSESVFSQAQKHIIVYNYDKCTTVPKYNCIINKYSENAKSCKTLVFMYMNKCI